MNNLDLKIQTFKDSNIQTFKNSNMQVPQKRHSNHQEQQIKLRPRPVCTKITISIFSKNTKNCFAYNSATIYRSEAVLYSNQMAGYPLSPHIKTITVAFLQAEI